MTFRIQHVLNITDDQVANMKETSRGIWMGTPSPTWYVLNVTVARVTWPLSLAGLASLADREVSRQELRSVEAALQAAGSVSGEPRTQAKKTAVSTLSETESQRDYRLCACHLTFEVS